MSPLQQAQGEDHEEHEQDHDAPAVVLHQDGGRMAGRQPAQRALPHVCQQRKVPNHRPLA